VRFTDHPQKSNIPSVFFLYRSEIGLFLLTFAAFFIALGVLLLFDRGLLAFGNLLFVTKQKNKKKKKGKFNSLFSFWFFQVSWPCVVGRREQRESVFDSLRQASRNNLWVHSHTNDRIN
jgi:hypothetical protein